jgi:hypothetical protein
MDSPWCIHVEVDVDVVGDGDVAGAMIPVRSFSGWW